MNMDAREMLLRERALALGLTKEDCAGLNGIETADICALASKRCDLRDNAAWQQHYNDVVGNAKRQKVDMLADDSGNVAVSRIINYIRESDDIVYTLYAWTGYYLPNWSHRRLMNLLNTWENEITQNNYIKNEIATNQDEYDEEYFREKGNAVCMEEMTA